MKKNNAHIHEYRHEHEKSCDKQNKKKHTDNHECYHHHHHGDKERNHN